MQIPLNRNETAFIDFANTGFYAPIGYLPQAFLYRLFAWLNIGPGYAFYLGRIAMFGFWLFVCYMAICTTPIYKTLFAILLLLPASLAFHISLNPDVVVHGLGFLFFSLVLKFHIGHHPVRIRQLMLLALLVTIITLLKPNLIFLGLLLLLLPTPQKLNPTWRIPVLMLCLIPAFTALLFMRSVSHKLIIPFDQYHVDFRQGQTLQPGADPIAQLDYIKNNPGRIVKVFARSWVQSAPATMAHYIGKFGWYHHYLPAWMIALLLAGLFIASQLETIFLSRITRFILITTGFVLLGFFSVTMYMLWTPVGHTELLNLQGRYFVLIFPLFIMGIQGINPLKNKNWFYVLGFIWILTNLFMLVQLFKRFW